MTLTTNGGWQRANIVAAATYLREQIVRGDDGPRVRAVYEGLMEVLDPARRTTRRQRELATAAQGAATKAGVERRRAGDRRSNPDRRRANLGNPTGERRSGKDRRSGRDRRNP